MTESSHLPKGTEGIHKKNLGQDTAEIKVTTFKVSTSGQN